MDLYNYLVNIRTLEIERRTLGQSLNSIEKKMNRLGIKDREPYYDSSVTEEVSVIKGDRGFTSIFGIKLYLHLTE